MKTIIKIFICLSLIYTPFFAFAGAAEKWDYEVSPIPDQNQRVVVTGHKVDQYGDAVNDSKYKTTIDPKTLPNKQKMGGVAIAKLLKKANWASAGVEAFQALLEGIDWVMDPESQSIWRYKNITSFPCKNFGHKWKYQSSSFACPSEAAEALMQEHESVYSNKDYRINELWTDQYKTQKISDLSEFTGSKIYVDFSFLYIPTGTRVDNGGYIDRGEQVEFETQIKEYLTPEIAADYANKTHPDYNNPAYKPKLDEKYKPEIVPNLWKPHNEWEKTNSPTVQEVERQLEQANPTSNDKDIEQKTDEQGNPTGAFSLPEFCSWATPVCDFFKWLKQNDELPDNESPEIVEHITPDLKEDAISWGSACPADVSIPISMQGVSSTLVFSWSPWCQLLSIIKPAIVASAYIGAAFIVLGLRT